MRSFVLLAVALAASIAAAQTPDRVKAPAQDGYRAMRSYPHIIAFPAAAIFLTILSLNILGNGLRDILDPKQR